MDFNGTYTIENVKTGEHRTFRVRTQKKDARFAAGKRIIALLNGSDNEHSYKGFGFVRDKGIDVWRRYCGPEPTIGNIRKWSAYEWYAFMIWDLAMNSGARLAEMGKHYTLTMSKTCRRCNRKLTTPESLRQGIGPICAGRTGA